MIDKDKDPQADSLIGCVGIFDLAGVPAGGSFWGAGQPADLVADDDEMNKVSSSFDINHEHPDYAVKRAMWRQYRDLYAGGEQFKMNADRYLVDARRSQAMCTRRGLSRSFYENYIGSIVDWYTATLFRREPVMAFEGRNERAKRFFSEFIEDCDLKGTSLAEFFRKQFIEALIGGKSFALIDFPRLSHPAGTSSRGR